MKVLEPTSNKEILTVAIPAGKSWVRQSFACEPKQNLMYQAQFTPVIWEAERGKIYSAHEIWALPDEVKLGSEAWNVSVCYPKDFSEVPLPPEATNKCGCDFSTVPAIKP